MGGLGAAYLGGRLPGFFGSIGVLSGFVDLQIIPEFVSLGMDSLSRRTARIGHRARERLLRHRA